MTDGLLSQLIVKTPPTITVIKKNNVFLMAYYFFVSFAALAFSLSTFAELLPRALSMVLPMVERSFEQKSSKQITPVVIEASAKLNTGEKKVNLSPPTNGIHVGQVLCMIGK